MAYLAANAGQLSFRMLRAGYAGHEDLAAVCARHRGDASEAARHYANVVSTFSEDGWWRTNPLNKPLPLWYPFPAMVLRHAFSPDVPEGRVPRLEAIYRVRLGNALIEEGRPDLAASQFARAVELWET